MCGQYTQFSFSAYNTNKHVLKKHFTPMNSKNELIHMTCKNK